MEIVEREEKIRCDKAVITTDCRRLGVGDGQIIFGKWERSASCRLKEELLPSIATVISTSWRRLVTCNAEYMCLPLTVSDLILT